MTDIKSKDALAEGVIIDAKMSVEDAADAVIPDADLPVAPSGAKSEMHLAVTDGESYPAAESSRVSKLRRIHRKQESSELRSAERQLSAAGVAKLSALEERSLDDLAETDQERRELRVQAEGEKLRQLAMREAKHQVNREVPARLLVNRPTFGQVRGNVFFHMRDSFAFLLGRNVNGKPHISGLFEGANAVTNIQRGFLAGCPYAAWFLVRIEHEMDKFRELVQNVEAESLALVRSVTAVTMEPYTSKRPSAVPLIFATKYGFLFVDLLKRYDEILRIMKAYEDAGFVTREDYKVIEGRMSKSLRMIFKLPTQWSFVGRDAVLQQTAQFFAAEQSMGVLPEGYLDGTLKPRLVEIRGGS